MDAKLFSTMTDGVVNTSKQVKVSFPKRENIRGTISKIGDALYLEWENQKRRLYPHEVITIQKLN